MNEELKRYKKMEMTLMLILLGSILFYIFYLVVAGNGIIWLKVILSILTILTSGTTLFFLYKSGEVLRRRSLWMSVAAGAIIICTLFSLILNYPSPSPFQ